MLKRYDVEICDCADGTHTVALEFPDGEYYKVAEAREVMKNISRAVIQAHRHGNFCPFYNTSEDYTKLGKQCCCVACQQARAILAEND